MPLDVSSNRFLDFVTRKMMRGWIEVEPEHPRAWTPLARPLADCTVALLSSAGIALADDRPFDQQGERDNPWWGDPGFRVIPNDATGPDVRFFHLHVDRRPAEQDLDCVLPLRRLVELCEQGVIGGAAGSHYSIMGYLPRARPMLEQSVPPIVERMRSEQVDLCLLVPV